MNLKNEIWRKPNPENPAQDFVKRIHNGKTQELIETTISEGEVVDPDDELLTTEKITIVRRIGQQTGF